MRSSSPNVFSPISLYQFEEEGRDDPEVLDAAKDYTFQAMERDAFPLLYILHHVNLSSW